MMDGLNIDPEVLINTQANTIAQQSMRMVQLEAAVQQLAQENAQLREQVPTDKEVKEDAVAN
jgi:hypothetical protein